ncbi:MAG: HAD family hydrolase, partial [Anaerostipes hadrus]
KTTLYPLNEAVDVPKWTYHHMELSKNPEIEEILGHKYKGTYHEPVNSVEFVPLGVNKAKGIEVILDHTGISREDSYAVGDSANDIDMIKYVKYGGDGQFSTRVTGRHHIRQPEQTRMESKG